MPVRDPPAAAFQLGAKELPAFRCFRSDSTSVAERCDGRQSGAQFGRRPSHWLSALGRPRQSVPDVRPKLIGGGGLRALGETEPETLHQSGSSLRWPQERGQPAAGAEQGEARRGSGGTIGSGGGADVESGGPEIACAGFDRGQDTQVDDLTGDHVARFGQEVPLPVYPTQQVAQGVAFARPARPARWT